MLFAVFVDEHCALAAQRYQHVFSAHLLELLGVFFDVRLGLDFGFKYLGKLLTVGLYQKRLKFERVDKQLFCSVNNDFYILVADALEHPLVNVVGHGVGYTARDNECVAVFDPVYLLEQSFKLRVIDMRTLAVDLGFFTRFDLDIDARDTVLELDEIRDYPVVADTLFDSFSGEARHKSVGGAVKPELGEHAGDVYSLAAEVVFLACGAVCDPARQLVEPYDIVDRGV